MIVALSPRECLDIALRSIDGFRREGADMMSAIRLTATKYHADELKLGVLYMEHRL